MTLKEIQELQSRIRRGVIILFDIAEAIDKLPDGDLRNKMVDKHQCVLERINELENILGEIDKGTCYYGFTTTCTGEPCAECSIMAKALNPMVLNKDLLPQ